MCYFPTSNGIGRARTWHLQGRIRSGMCNPHFSKIYLEILKRTTSPTNRGLGRFILFGFRASCRFSVFRFSSSNSFDPSFNLTAWLGRKPLLSFLVVVNWLGLMPVIFFKFAEQREFITGLWSASTWGRFIFSKYIRRICGWVFFEIGPQLQGVATGGIGDSFVLLPRILWCWCLLRALS